MFRERLLKKSPFTKIHFAVGNRGLYEMSDWTLLVSEPKKKSYWSLKVSSMKGVRKLWKTRKVKATEVSIDEIAYANGEEGTLNAYMCVQGRERAKNWSQCVFLQNGWTPTVSLKDISESLILKIHNIAGICASRFFVLVSFL